MAVLPHVVESIRIKIAETLEDEEVEASSVTSVRESCHTSN